MEKILAHRRSETCFQWLTLIRGCAIYDAQWQTTRDFVDDDGTITTSFHDYISEYEFLSELPMKLDSVDRDPGTRNSNKRFLD